MQVKEAIVIEVGDVVQNVISENLLKLTYKESIKLTLELFEFNGIFLYFDDDFLELFLVTANGKFRLAGSSAYFQSELVRYGKLTFYKEANNGSN